MQERIEKDLKTAMLAGDKTKAETLKGVKSALQNEAISLGAKDTGLNDQQIQAVLTREAKKRTEAAEMYQKGGAADRAAAEQAEKAVIEVYLPEQMDEAAIRQLVREQINETGATGIADMGRVIGAVKARAGGSADGATVARITKELLSGKL